MKQYHQPPSTHALAGRPVHAQQGVVLIISLIMLGLLSLMAATSLRNAGLTENLANNVRTTELATRAAEIALRYCETNAADFVVTDSGGPFWSQKTSKGVLTYWDSDRKYVNMPPATDMQQSGLRVTFKRRPECMVESQVKATQDGTGGTPVEDVSYVVTARGFGPEVANGTGQPDGTEVWLQSFID